MKDSMEKEWSPNYPVPEEDRQAYRNRIAEEMEKVQQKIDEISTQPFKEKEIWATVGNIRYGHPTALLTLRHKALLWYSINPPDPRGERMCSRPGPYQVYVDRADLMELFDRSASTIDRILATVRKAAFIKPYEKITVERFCFLNSLNEDKIQQQLHEIFLKRWNKYKSKG
ncbi:MAG TPA: hypothetical protein VIM79_11970 [Niastella sp.]